MRHGRQAKKRRRRTRGYAEREPANSPEQRAKRDGNREAEKTYNKLYRIEDL